MINIQSLATIAGAEIMKKSYFIFLLFILPCFLFCERISIQDVLDEINFVRTNPQGYISVLKECLNTFNGMDYMDRIGRTISSEEGVEAIYECIEVLKNTKPMKALKMNKNLCDSALWLAKDQAYFSTTGHVGSDGSTTDERVKRAGFKGNRNGENCAYGLFTARDFISSLLIDDGVPSRGHRDNILKKDFHEVGIAIAFGHSVYNSVLVMDFGGDISKDDYPIPTPQQILEEINLVRTNPKAYIEILRERLSTFNDMDYVDEVGRKMRSHEGTKAICECIEVLKNTEPMKALNMNKNLCQSAIWLANDNVYSGKTGHIGSDGSTFVERMKRVGFVNYHCSENSAYGFFTARDFLLNFLIDDGLKGRGRRANILNRSFNQVGIGLVAGHPKYNSVLIIDFLEIREN